MLVHVEREIVAQTTVDIKAHPKIAFCSSDRLMALLNGKKASPCTIRKKKARAHDATLYRILLNCRKAIRVPQFTDRFRLGPLTPTREPRSKSNPILRTTMVINHYHPFRYMGQGIEHDITHVVVDESVKFIPANAFTGSGRLVEIQLHESIESIGSGAFRNCISLTKISIPESCVSIERNAFSSCTALEEVIFLGDPPIIAKIGHFCFRLCSSLKSIEFPDSIQQLGDGTLEGCKSLTSCKLPKSLSSIYQSTFLGCESLMKMQIPENVQVIDDYAFASCSKLDHLQLPPNVREIRSQCFSGCIGLYAIHIPESVQVIGVDAFSGCKELTSINFPNQSTLSIGDDTLARCSSLICIDIPMLSHALWPRLFWQFGNRGLFELSPRLFERVGLDERTRNTCVFSFLQENVGQLFGYGANENTESRKEEVAVVNPFGAPSMTVDSPSASFAFGSGDSSFQFGAHSETSSQKTTFDTLSSAVPPSSSTAFSFPSSSGSSFGLPMNEKGISTSEPPAFSFGKSEAPANNSRRNGTKGRLKGRVRR